MRKILSLLLGVSIALTNVCYGLPQSEFSRNNPDVQKYEYARSFIASLTYIKSVHERWHRSDPAKKYEGSKDVTLMRGFLSYLIKDNTDLRVAKNYLVSYLQSPNSLIRKSADTFILGCNTVIAINDKEKEIWDQWNAVKANNLGTRTNETAFLNAQEELALKRKEAFKLIIQSSLLLSKVLRSERNKDENGKLLAITDTQRQKLIKYLDEIGRKNLDWGLKPGQSFQQASVAIIREILEDPIYKSQL